MTEDLIRRLIAAGLTKQQASSVTAETLVNLFMPDDGKVLIREAQGQVAEMRQLVNDLKKEYTDLKRKVEGLSDTLLAISEAQKEHGVITDEKTQNVVALYAALLTMGEKAGADAEDAVRNAGYVVYAYLGGQARRDITYTQEFEKQLSLSYPPVIPLSVDINSHQINNVSGWALSTRHAGCVRWWKARGPLGEKRAGVHPCTRVKGLQSELFWKSRYSGTRGYRNRRIRSDRLAGNVPFTQLFIRFLPFQGEIQKQLEV